MIDTTGRTTLTFDVVGTVIDFEQGILDWWRPYLRSRGIENADIAILEGFAAAEDRLQRERPDLPFTAMLPRIHEVLVETWGLPRDPEAARSFQASIAHWPAFPDSVPALRRLAQRFRLVAVTNADAWATAAMGRTAGDLFDEQVTCDEVGANKPDPRVFEYALNKAGISRGETIHFAQSQYHDIGGAKAFGLTTAWVERRRGQSGTGATPSVAEPVDPDLHVADLAELADHLCGNADAAAR